MSRLFAAAFLYFLLAFSAGFVLGALRVTMLEPRLGALAATLIETPFMLVVSWLAAKWTVARLSVERALAPRLFMGVVALALLLTAEALLGAIAFGRTLDEQRAAMFSAPGLVGLAAQVLFALVPAALLFGRR